MNIPDDIRATLEAYIQGTLATHAAANVQQLLKTDTTWREAYQHIQAELQGIRYDALRTKALDLQAFENDIKHGLAKPHDSLSGDLSVDSTSGIVSNKKTDMESKNEASGTLVMGMRYGKLKEVLGELEEEEGSGMGNGDMGVGNGNLFQNPNSQIRILPKHWWAIAASLTIIIIASWPWIRTKTYAEKLIESGFVVPPMTELYRGATEDSIEMLIQKAYGYYAEGDYKRALKYFEMVPMQNDEYFYLYFGSTLILNNKNKEGDSIIHKMNSLWPKLKKD